MVDVVVDGVEVLGQGGDHLVLRVRFADLHEGMVDLGVEEDREALEKSLLAVLGASKLAV